MADEYRVLQLGAESINTGTVNAPIRVHQVGAEVVNTGVVNPAVRVHYVGIEVIRSLIQASRPAFFDEFADGDTFAPKFSESYQPLLANENEEFQVYSIQWVKGTNQSAPSIASPGEWNPYRPNLQGGDVESYLDEQAGILREQHNKLQAGDTTFDVARLIKTSTEKEFTLGSLGRFYSEDYGLILARYVQFTGMVADQLNPAPVGRLANSESVDWVVTNDFEKSGRELAVGIGFFDGVPASGSYGWVVTHGPNPFPLIAETEVIPNQNSPYAWTSTGKVGLASRGNVVCRRWGKAFGYGIGAGTVFIALEQMSPAELVWAIQQEMAEEVQRITTLEGRVTTTETLITNQGTLITAQATSLTDLETRIAREESTRSRENQALRNLIGTGVDVDAAILSGINLVRAEFATADDAIRATAVEALRVANQALTFSSGIDGASIGESLDALTTQLGGIITRLSGVTFNLTGMVAEQTLKAVAVGTDSLGNTIFEFQPFLPGIDWLSDVDTTTTPPTNGQALVWDSADSKWKPGTISGGGGGSVGLSFDYCNISVNTASGTAFATKGNYFLALADFTLDSIVARLTLVSGATYRARAYQVTGTGTSDTITAIVDNGVDFVASAAATLTLVRLKFAATASFVTGNMYVLAVSRTDGAGTYALPISRDTGGSPFSDNFPIAFASGTAQIANVAPTVSTTIAGASTGHCAIGIIGTRSDIV